MSNCFNNCFSNLKAPCWRVKSALGRGNVDWMMDRKLKLLLQALCMIFDAAIGTINASVKLFPNSILSLSLLCQFVTDHSTALQQR